MTIISQKKCDKTSSIILLINVKHFIEGSRSHDAKFKAIVMLLIKINWINANLKEVLTKIIFGEKVGFINFFHMPTYIQSSQ